MSDLLAGRLLMSSTLMFHIIFAAVGMAMPWLMAVAHFRWLRTEDEVYKDLTKAWSKGVAIFFATGAVSGTVLTFELGLLWPEFMQQAGPIIGLPLALEGAAFFAEAVALGLFLYGWKVLNKWVHFGAGVAVGIAGVASAILVLAANSFMNDPVGLESVNGALTMTLPLTAIFNRAWFIQAVHMVLAAFVATGFGVAGIHAYQLLKHPQNPLHRRAITIAMVFAAGAAILQPISGDASAKNAAERQPIKLAAMEAHFETAAGAPLVIGGIPDVENETVSLAIYIPKALSFLAKGDFNATVQGLEEFPKDEWPPILITHLSFQAMVGIGFLLAGVGVLMLLILWRWRKALHDRRFLRAVALMTPLGFIALEAGWLVTEVGRQPWIINQMMRVEEALTSMPGLVVPLVFFLGIYALLFAVMTWLMLRQIKVVNIKYGTDTGEEALPPSSKESYLLGD